MNVFINTYVAKIQVKLELTARNTNYCKGTVLYYSSEVSRCVANFALAPAHPKNQRRNRAGAQTMSQTMSQRLHECGTHQMSA